MEIRKCADCDKAITFDDFCRNSPNLNKKSAKELWENPIISIYCLECFFNRPERPFKIQRGYYRHYYRKMH